MNLNFLRRQAIISSQARKRNLPYLCELEYLESTGEQYIDIGYQLQTTDTVKHVVTQQYAYKSTAQYENHVTAPRYFGVNYANIYTVGGTDAGIKSSGNSYDNIVFEGTPTQGTVVVNGVVAASRVINVSRSLNIYIFGACGSSKELQYPCYVKKKSHQIYVNDVLIFDGIPVLDYNMKPAMYDRVTKKLFYNEGTGADFKYGLKDNAGNLYTSVSYIESTGEQYITIPYKIVTTDTFRHETANQYTQFGTNQYEGQTSGGNWYGINGSGNYTIGGGVVSSFTASTTDFDNIVADSDETGLTLTVNGNIVGTRSSKSSGQKVCIFDCYNPNASATGNYYNFVRKKYHKFYVNNKPYFIGIPVINLNGKPAMFDIVTKKPFYNDGTGADFIVGE